MDEKTKSFWSNGLIAKLYRRYAGKRFLKMYKKIAEHVLAEKPRDVLDIGCGPGDFLFYLSSLNPNLNLTGTDPAPGMVTHARNKLRDKAKILEFPAEQQPFPSNSFDAVTVILTFHHIREKTGVLQNARKLLRPGGTLIIGDIIAKSDLQKKFWNFLERIESVRGYVGHYTSSDLRELAERVGFNFSIENVLGMARRYKICRLT